MSRVFLLISLFCLLNCAHISAVIPQNGPARAASWPATVDYSSSTAYKHAGEFFTEKVSVSETACSDQGYLFNLFSSLIPPAWFYNEPKTTVHHYDPVDGLTLGVLIPDPDVVERSLAIMHYTKSFERDGQQPYGTSGRIAALPYIDLLCNALCGKVNRGRLAKTITIPRTVAEFNVLPAAAKYFVKHMLPKDTAYHIMPTPEYNKTTKKIVKACFYATVCAAAIKTYFAHKDEHVAVADGIRCLRHILDSDKLTITTPQEKNSIRALITKLKNKVCWGAFGWTIYGRSYRASLDELLAHQRLQN